MKHIKLFERYEDEPINEAITFGFEGLPVVGDVVVKVVYSGDIADFIFASGNSVAGFTSDKMVAVEAAGLTAEYNKVEREFKEPFTIDGKKANMSDIRLVMEEGKDARLVPWVTVYSGKDTQLSSGTTMPETDYVDYELDDLRNAIDKQ